MRFQIFPPSLPFVDEEEVYESIISTKYFSHYITLINSSQHIKHLNINQDKNYYMIMRNFELLQHTLLS